MSILPISNIINVTITNTPSGLTEKNVNSLALFTNEASNSFEPFGIYISAAQVAEDYGTDSVTAQMANANRSHRGMSGAASRAGQWRSTAKPANAPITLRASHSAAAAPKFPAARLASAHTPACVTGMPANPPGRENRIVRAHRS